MTLTPFRGRCHTCGHDHDAEETLARDVIELTRQADAERRRAAAAVPVEVVQALRDARDLAVHLAPNPPTWGADIDRRNALVKKIDAALATLQAAEPSAKKEPDHG